MYILNLVLKVCSDIVWVVNGWEDAQLFDFTFTEYCNISDFLELFQEAECNAEKYYNYFQLTSKETGKSYWVYAKAGLWTGLDYSYGLDSGLTVNFMFLSL